jgi:NAD(P)-dependent dehydrogenase (short-subunit alcohol dehydrogenase family)
MERRTCIVTGGTSGVGKAIARGLARAGHEVIIAARDRKRGEETAGALRDAAELWIAGHDDELKEVTALL